MAAILLIFILVKYPSQMFDASADGVLLWFNVVFPSLFPFMVVVNILTEIGTAKHIGKYLEPIMKPLFNVSGAGAFPLIMGILSGYPMGAKIASDLREKNIISQTEAQRIMSFANNSGPLFVIGTVATGMLSMPYAGYLMLLSIFLASITTGIIFRFYKGNTESSTNKHTYTKNKLYNKNLGETVSVSIKNSMDTITIIGGYIILFSVISKALSVTGILSFLSIWVVNLLNLKNSLICEGIITGFIEMTNGSNMLSDISYLSNIMKIATIAGILSFGGLSIFFQTTSITSKTDIKSSVYFVSKIINSFFAFMYCYLLYPLFEDKLSNVVPAFKMYSVSAFNFLIYTILILLILSLVFILTTLIGKRNK